MSEYIKREDAIAAVGRGSNTIRTIQRIETIPAADVVEVVRCKNCKYYSTTSLRGDDGEVYEIKYCHRFGLAYKPNDYISHGKGGES